MVDISDTNDPGPFAHSKPRLCEHCQKVETVYDFCSGECASAHYKAISNLIDGTTIREYQARIAALEASLAAAERNERRYLWLKGHWVGRDQIFSQQIWNAGWNELDAAIDALATKERK